MRRLQYENSLVYHETEYQEQTSELHFKICGLGRKTCTTVCVLLYQVRTSTSCKYN
jgi:hypothetical protein